MTRFYQELKRRKVFQVGSVYLVVAWGASLGAADLLPAFDVPPWGVRMFVTAAVLGFPVAVGLAWLYEMSADGIRLDAPDQPASRRGSAATTQLAKGAASVRVTWDPGGGRSQHSFANTFTIGRDEVCELQVDDEMVSRRHARISVDRGIWYVEDLGSRNGTRLDGELVTRAPLPDRSELLLYPGGPAMTIELLGRVATVAALRTGD
ncbi:MAG: FHA domain-containing protein [Pseudomonadales bacterium]